MRYILTNFDYNQYPPLPLRTLILSKNGIKKYILYAKGTGKKLREIHDDIKECGSSFSGALVNDFKSHVVSFGLPRKIDYNVYDLNIPRIKIEDSFNSLKLIAKSICKKKATTWRKLISNSSSVYQYLEDVGIYHGYKKNFPKYSLDTLSGRSKTSVFNIQGTTSNDDIRHINDKYDHFIHFDWVGADILMAAHMSGDEELLSTFYDSDPYTKISEMLKIDRDQAKKELMRAIYSLSVHSPILELFPKFREWMIESIRKMNDNGYTESLLGRRFYIRDESKKLGVFNAQFQGSVAHAMQATLIKVFKHYNDNILTEVHDSVILCCRKSEVSQLVSDISDIMLNPLDGYMIGPPVMPLKVSVGKRWRRWKYLKTVRGQK